MSDGPNPDAAFAAPLAAVRHASGVIADPVPVYYQRFAPLDRAARATVVMIHGGAHTGSCYEVTADGRPGWAHLFARAGYAAVVPDWPGLGRSGAVPHDRLDGDTVVRGLGALVARCEGPVVLLGHSMGGALTWPLAERHAARVAAVVGVAPGPPGNIQPRPTVLAEDAEGFDLETPYRRARLPRRGAVANERAFVEAKLVGESRRFPRARLDAYAASLLDIPAGLLRQRLNVEGAQLRVEDPARLAHFPILVLTGTHDLEHPREADEAVVTWLNGHGGRAEFLWLGDRGLVGNGHMLMLEENSDAVAGVILDWLAARGIGGAPGAAA